MLAPAGSGILYDSRTWHRPCPECNDAGGDRIAILNAIITPQHPPMSHKEGAADQFNKSKIPEMLTQREREVVAHLMQPGETGDNPNRCVTQ